MCQSSRMFALLALGLMAFGSSNAFAGWNNVFHTTGCCDSPRTSYYAPAPSPCCPSVSYVQRCYYQPVTTYKMESYTETVTTYKTTYEWEPVTRYRYTSYYDPCSGCCQNVAQPYTTYYQRAKCNPVQSYVQRCRMVPVTEMRRSYYLEPVVSYSDPCGNTVAPGAMPPAGVSEQGGQTREPELPRIAPGKSESLSKPIASPGFRPERTASLPNAGRMQGQVLSSDRISPKGNATIQFVSTGKAGTPVTAKTDRTGRFVVEIPAGEYEMFVPGESGKMVYHSVVLVKNTDDRNVTIVSR